MHSNTRVPLQRTGTAWAVTWVALGGLFLASCSSSQTSEEAESTEEEAYSDAGTDVVPAEGAENPDPAADPLAEAPPSDPAANQSADPYADPNAGATTDPYAADPYAQAAPPAEPQPATDYSSSSAEAGMPSSSGAVDTYSVKSGDTLMKVAFEVYGDLYQWRKIYDANRDVISDPNQIPPGVTLKIEPPTTPVQVSRNGQSYEIRKGDTLGTISQQVYGTTSRWREIWENNRELIRDPNKIYAGFTLYYVPGETAGATMSSNEPAPASGAESNRQPAAAPTEAQPAASGTN